MKKSTRSQGFFKDRHDFCRRIKNLRRYLGMTQKQFGRQLGVCSVTVSKWERTSSETWPSNSVFIRIMDLEDINILQMREQANGSKQAANSTQAVA
jgi:DNA-binding transcriptional regulator YiaG